MPFTSRRIVTGHDSTGRAVIRRDDTLRSAVVFPTLETTEIWCTNSLPVDNNEASYADGRPGAPGTRALCRIAETTPHNGEGFMHRSQTLDYAIVLEGEIELRLDGGERAVLKAGDVVVQRGTNHAWVNRSDQPSRIAFILIDAKPLTVGDQTLSEYFDELPNDRPGPIMPTR